MSHSRAPRFTPHFVLIAVFALALVVNGCGGGDEESGDIPMPEPEIEIPTPEPETDLELEVETVQEPVSTLDPESDYPEISDLPTPTQPGSLTYYRGDRETVTAYLGDVLEGEGVRRFLGSPVLVLGESVLEEDVDTIRGVVDVLNEALPGGNGIRVESSLRATENDSPSAGEIILHLIDSCAGQLVCVASGTAGVTTYNDDVVLNGVGSYGAEIVIDKALLSGFFGTSAREELGQIVGHELLHALGLRGHVRQSQRSAINEYNLHGVQPSDRDGLAGLYTLDEGESFDDLGDWNVVNQSIEGTMRVPFHLNGIVFGARLGDGQLEAYVDGPPAPDLTENPTRQWRLEHGFDLGKVTWGGALLGMTPSQATVTGDAHLSVDLEHFTGRADFTRLETWAKEPGTPGTGAAWGSGRLGYTIAVTGNSFAQTGGDDGILTGAFFGGRHEAMGGTLERDDLTAAFGGLDSSYIDR